MAGIPAKCPHCGNKKQWKEVPNRIRSVSIRGLFARPIKKVLGYYTVQYHCHKCGFQAEYELSD